MKRVLHSCFLFVFLSLSLTLSAQVESVDLQPDTASAVVDIQSDTRGVLLPRVTTLDRLSIVDPKEGLILYDTDVEKFMYYNGLGWEEVGRDPLWSINGDRIYYNTGNIGIGTSTPSRKLHLVNSDEEISAFFQNNYDGTSTKYGFYNYVTSAGTGIKYGLYNNVQSNNSTASSYGLYNTMSTTNATGNMYGLYSYIASSGSGRHYAIYAYANGAENYAIYGHNNNHLGHAGYFNGVLRATDRIYVGLGDHDSDGITVFNQDIFVKDPDSTTIRLRHSGAGTGGEIELYMADEFRTLELQASETSTTGSQIQMYKADGSLGISLDADYLGCGRVIMEESEVTGCDLAEYFPVSTSSSTEYLPGMLMAIDATRSGHLTIAQEAYDKKLVGVLSGANGIKPGYLMGGTMVADEEKALSPDTPPLALAGRVYVLASNVNGAIEPGDLITSSAIPGYAMKVTDHAKAQGAIIGKAMESFDQRDGYLLVFVNLQ